MVIAIISLLAGLLLPALTRAKAKAHTIYCANNLRQWGIATHLYTADHGDFLPPDGRPNPDENDTNAGWYVALPREINLPRYHDQRWRTNPAVAPGRSLWICPANRRRSNGRNLFHYCLNEHVNGTGAEDRPMLLSSIPRPSAVVWLFDTKNLPAVGYWSFVHTNLHQQGANFLFLDSHVQRFPVANNLPGRANTNHPAIVWIP